MQTFKLDINHQFKSFRECLLILGWVATGSIIGYLFFEAELISISIIGILFWLATAFLMVLPFHIQYLIENWHTSLIVYTDKEEIEIKHKLEVFNYPFSEITVNRFLLGHYKPGRSKSWVPISFDNYGYVRITSNDGRSFVITSLMTDPFNFPLPIDSTEYGSILIKESEANKKIRLNRVKNLKNQEEQIRVEYFTDKFKALPNNQLKTKLENREKMAKEAVIAVERILDQR